MAVSGGNSGQTNGFRAATSEALAQGKRKTQRGAEVGEALVEEVGHDSDAAYAAAEMWVEHSDHFVAKNVRRFAGPERTMIGVLVVAVVLYLMPTILSKVGEAGGNDVSGPLGNISSGEEAVGIIEFGWLVPLLMIVFMVFTYLRQAQ